MSICIYAAGKTTVLAAQMFTLAWTHSVEKTLWEEDWRVSASGMEIVEARVRGSGAGIDPPEGAVLVGDAWTFRPKLPPQPELVLALSGATGEGWSVCAERVCTDLPEMSPEPARIAPCNLPR